MKTAFLTDPRFAEHETGPGHPERAARLTHTLDHLRAQQWFSQLLPVESQTCDERWLRSIHDRTLIERARQACSQGRAYLDSPDVAVSQASFEIALLAAGGVLALADAVIQGKANNGFALVRPPGHHAERDVALGFCLFNNIAIAARYLQQEYGLEKIVILDWDVHHGNGTQHSFESDPSIFYISLHQYPHYPGTGAYSETGIGDGSGTTLNCPMPAGSDDSHYEQAFREKILPAVNSYSPDVILISAGFDAHQADPLGSINLSTAFYAWMTERMLETADQHANGRLISVLEGGYALDALAASVSAHLQSLAGISLPDGRSSRDPQ